MDRFFPGRAAEWKPASTSCCEYRLRTNATVDGGAWYNWNTRHGVQGCGEENWSPGPSYLAHERFWPTFDNWQSRAVSTTCVLPRNPQGAVDTSFCSVNANFRHPDALAKRDTEEKVVRRMHHR